MGEESRRDAGADAHLRKLVLRGELLQLLGHTDRSRMPGRPHAADPMQWIRISQHRPQLGQSFGVSDGEQGPDRVCAWAILASCDHWSDAFNAAAIQAHQ